MRLDRREFGKVLAAGVAGSIAGCGGSGRAGVSAADLEGTTLTVMVDADTVNPQLNPYAISRQPLSVLDVLDQLVLPAVAPTGDHLTSGHSWSVDGTEVSVPCAVRDCELDPPEGYTLTFDDRLTYWSGEPLDARAYYLADHVWYLLNWAFDEGHSFGGRLESDTEYRWTYPGGRNRLELAHGVFPGRPPFPPSFTESWHERLVDAASASAVDDVFEAITDVTVDFETYATEGYGTGAFAIESPDDLYTNAIVARAREEHPGDVAASNLLVELAGGTMSDRAVRSAVENGDVDVGNGVVAAKGGDLTSLSGGMEQVSIYPSPRDPAYQLRINWADEHLRRLWVRRAVAAAAPFRRMLANAPGRPWRPPAHHTGLLSRVDEATFGGDFLSALPSYPFARDDETAATWLDRAGYAERDGLWRAPDGTPVSLRVLVVRGSGAQSRMGRTLVRGLRSFGLDATLLSRRAENASDALRSGSYELAFGRVPGGWSPAEQYATDVSIAGTVLWGTPLAIAGNPIGTCDGGDARATIPGTVTLPAEPSLSIEGVAYRDGGASYRHDAGVDASVCDAVDRLDAADADEAAIQDALATCARWYNYALPNVVFAQVRTGLVAKTSAFALPRESPATTATRHWTDDPEEYHVQAGTLR